MDNKKFVITIPARLDSKRLPCKVLEPIGKKSMIYRVMENCSNFQSIEKVFLCTDNISITNEVRNLPIEIVYKEGDFTSGTDRIFHSSEEILEKLSLSYKSSLNNIYLINVQADQPFIDGQIINQFIQFIIHNNSPEIVTSYYKKDYLSVENCKDIVKLTLSSKNSRALYFSRSNIPYIDKSCLEDIEKSQEYKINCHIGVYAYRFDILQEWSHMNQGYLEKLESLEQLRWLDYEIPIYAFESSKEIISVDNMAQLEYARSLI